MNSLAKRFTWGDGRVGGNCVWCLVIVIIFYGTWGSKEVGTKGGGFRVIIWREGVSHKEGQFCRGEMTPLDLMSVYVIINMLMQS